MGTTCQSAGSSFNLHGHYMTIDRVLLTAFARAQRGLSWPICRAVKWDQRVLLTCLPMHAQHTGHSNTQRTWQRRMGAACCNTTSCTSLGICRIAASFLQHVSCSVVMLKLHEYVIVF